MKKSKLLIPALSIAGLTATIAPITTSCSCNVSVSYVLNFADEDESPLGVEGYIKNELMTFKKGTTYTFELTTDAKDTNGLSAFTIMVVDGTKGPTMYNFSKVSTKVDGTDVASEMSTEKQQYLLLFAETIKTAGKKVLISITAQEDCQAYPFAGSFGG